uniref:Peptidase S8/S53 domain-containing protein n=1 Tax=Panagrolaimus sp. ES5 TaxID=591445 RepID=A0AC34FTW5_9BILA
EEFSKKFPEFDGRGILIAILDMGGVDVSLPGMRKTSEGLPKIIDCFEFTGLGNVDISTVKKVGNGKTLILKSNRKMKNIFWTKKQKDDFNVDFIVWNNGEKWQACLVETHCKNLENAKILTNFRDDHKYCIIYDNFACCITIADDGNSLELTTPDEGHGSYVAQVAAAYFPGGKPENNGSAPGAQIVFMNVFSMNVPSNVAMVEKALNKCIELGVDIINFSTSLPAYEDR